jgi:tRNA A-37 threonylcarbamoyl transferase component Bud32
MGMTAASRVVPESDSPNSGLPREVRLSRRAGKGVCVPECSRASLIRWIDYPELPLRTHVRETLKSGRSSLVVRADVPVGDGVVRIAYKRYSRRNLWKVVSGTFKASRANRAWRLGHLLRGMGIATPRPLVAVTPRSLSRRVDSYLATEFVEGFPLHQFAERLSGLPRLSQTRAAASVAENVGGLLGRLHAAGFRHRDLKTGNILIAGDLARPATVAAVLIDLDGVSRRRLLNRSLRLRDLSRLCVDFDRGLQQRPTAGARFVRAYLAACGDSSWQWRDCWRRLAGATELRKRQRRRKQRRAA